MAAGFYCIMQKDFHFRSNLSLIHFEYFQEKTLHVEGNKMVLGQKPPDIYPRQNPPDKNPQSKIFVFHFFKIFMVSQVQWLLV